MAELFLDNIYLALLLPLWIFLIIMLGRFFSVYVNKSVIYILTLMSSLFGSVLCGGALLKLSADKILETSFPFIKVQDFIVNCGLHVDRLALIFGLVLFLISFFIQLFSISYMKDEKKTYRFYALMNLFNFSMAGLFFSSNLFQSYFFWELVGVTSYLLIGFEYFKKEKSLASKKVFIINRIGDTALISAIIMSSYFIYAYAPNKYLVTLSFVDMNTISTLVYAYASNPLFEIICGLFIIGALVKSAQFPFYTWLQDAMEAKLPVSALLHSATLVAAGIFFSLRMLPFYTLEPVLLKIIAIVGLITAFLCSLSACAQIHPKKALAYSTSAQLGLIFFALGTMNIKAAIVLFVAHAIIKSTLFVTLPRENEKWDYIKFIVFLVSGLSLSGLIFSGMISKELLTNALGTTGTVLMSVLGFLTAFYIIRIALVVFDSNGGEKKEFALLEMISIIGLLVLNIGFYIYLHINTQYKIAEPFWSALTAWIVVYILYIKKLFWKVPVLYSLALNGFYLDKISMNCIAKIYDGVTVFSNWIEKNIFANYMLPLGFVKLGVKTSGFIENKIMNGCIIFVTDFFKKVSLFDLKAQSGNIQRYNAYAYIIITVILTCLTIGYTAMLMYIGG